MSASLVVALGLGAVLTTSTPQPLDRVLNGPANDASIFKARGDLKGCKEPSCQAVDHLAQAFKIATIRDLPNSMVQLNRPHGDPEREANRALRRLLPTAGALHPAFCPVLTKMARHYEAYSVGLLVIEFANRIDGAGEVCTREVIQALPSTKEMVELVTASRDSCLAARRSGCQRDQP